MNNNISTSWLTEKCQKMVQIRQKRVINFFSTRASDRTQVLLNVQLISTSVLDRLYARVSDILIHSHSRHRCLTSQNVSSRTRLHIKTTPYCAVKRPMGFIYSCHSKSSLYSTVSDLALGFFVTCPRVNSTSSKPSSHSSKTSSSLSPIPLSHARMI